MARVNVELSAAGWIEAASLMAKLPAAVRGKEIEGAMRKGLNKIKTRARQLVPKPGYPGDKPGLKPLRDTIGVVVRRYQSGTVIAGVVGPEYPAGAHGHLVELGHDIAPGGGRVKPHLFMQPAVAETQGQFEDTIMMALERAIVKHGG